MMGWDVWRCGGVEVWMDVRVFFDRQTNGMSKAEEEWKAGTYKTKQKEIRNKKYKACMMIF